MQIFSWIVIDLLATEKSLSALQKFKNSFPLNFDFIFLSVGVSWVMLISYLGEIHKYFSFNVALNRNQKNVLREKSRQTNKNRKHISRLNCRLLTFLDNFFLFLFTWPIHMVIVVLYVRLWLMELYCAVCLWPRSNVNVSFSHHISNKLSAHLPFYYIT